MSLNQKRGEWKPNELPAHIIDELELTVVPSKVLHVTYNDNGALEVLIWWQDLPLAEATWEVASVLQQPSPTFHLKDKVKLQTWGIATPLMKEKSRVTYEIKKKTGLL